ncbi:hypothetical protein [Cognatishimia sp. MH4019]|uniref:hypothetical protein n=1 Tax=Cognatishimia sp. MH4019 TaxID=2854030 RepID=UPI001CD5A8A8|nr:hypothetical protein [Cognatishimia sp. MH4019]
MDNDLLFVIGLVLGGFSIPAILSALSDGRAPRVATIVVVLSGVMVVYAISNKPGGYKINEIPEVFVDVVGRYIL